MKRLIASDLHGSAVFCRQLLALYRETGAQQLVLLGDLAYSGSYDPRYEYDPQNVIDQLNAIAPELQLATGEISEKLGRGKHTTRQVQLYPCAGGYLADTPGFSTFEVEQYLQMDKDCIADCFPEFRPYLGQCRFSDCAHVCEKGCAVVEAVRAGKIAKSRHDAYVSLYQTAKQRKAWES